MNSADTSVEGKVEDQVYFWSLLGPFIILLSIAVLLFKVSTHWYFPISALIGIPLCVKWKVKGLVGALACLFLLFLVNFRHLNLDERYWHVGMALAVAFSFIILVLSLEEVQSLVQKFRLESRSRLDNFLLLDEKFIRAESDWTAAKSAYEAQVQTIGAELSKITEEKQTFYKLAQLAKDELIEVRTRYDLLVQEVQYKKRQVSQLSEMLDESELTVQNFVNCDPQKEIAQLNDRLAQFEQERETLKTRIEFASQERQKAYEEKERIEKCCAEAKDLAKADFNQTLLRLTEKFEQENRSLNQSLQNARQEFEAARALALGKEEEVAQIRRELQTYKIQAADSGEKLQILTRSLAERDSALSVRTEQFEKEKQMLNRNLQNARDDFEANRTLLFQKEAELGQSRTELQAYKTQIKDFSERVQSLTRSVEEKDSTISVQLEKLKVAEGMKTESENLLNAVRAESENLLNAARAESEKGKLRLQAIHNERTKLPYAEGNSRKIESMYLQLKEQFLEKTAVLAETRQELFFCREKMLLSEKEKEEETIYGISEVEQVLHNELSALSREVERLEQDYENEIECLHGLISNLLSEKHSSD